mgnify:CR=1 FL=1
MTEINAELVMFRLDQIDKKLDDNAVTLKEHAKDSRETWDGLERRVDTLEKDNIAAGKSAGGKQGAVTGGVVGAAMILLTYAAEWIRSRVGA